jgi:hypothetical protein
MVLESLGKEEADSIDWRYPRLLCIAADFTRYDEHAVQQINRNIELLRYRRYGDELLLLELVNATTAQPIEQENHNGPTKTRPVGGDRSQISLQQKNLEHANSELRDRFEALRAFLLALGDDVQEKLLNYYIAFRRLRNFACIQI